jgi:hypothetical protein
VLRNASDDIQFTFSNEKYAYIGVGIATGYRLDDGGVGVPSPGRVKNFLHAIQTGSGAHPPSYPMDTGVKASGA